MLMKLASILIVAVVLAGFGALEMGTYYLSQQIASAMDDSANRIAAARVN